MKRVAVFMIFGQSNAVGHGVPMERVDYISEPLNNVFGLHRKYNQDYEVEELKFTGYTSFGMNLGETQDNTYSVPNQLAKHWQEEIDKGEDLPDLYIVQIAIGSQGLYGMWHPDRGTDVLIQGVHGIANISLYPLTIRVLSLLNDYFAKNELEPDYFAIHWRGGEQETDKTVSELEGKLKDLYKRVLGGMREALGVDAPFVLHRMPFVDVMKKADETGAKLESMNYINQVFEELSAELDKTTIFDIRSAPFYNPNEWDSGIFRWDLIHYSPKANDYVALEILKDYKSKIKA
ncbi:MAG: hypothetical protein J6B34_06385 [Clostridia bacterium]|nr:hypothetical protein [Clostridia bacterium]